MPYSLIIYLFSRIFKMTIDFYRISLGDVVAKLFKLNAVCILGLLIDVVEEKYQFRQSDCIT